MASAAEKFWASNSLSFVVGLSSGLVTTIELRNESHVTGRVVEVDGYMNVSLKDAIFCDQVGKRHKFASFFVPSRLIRYVQIPTEIDIRTAIKKRFGPKEANLGKGRGAKTEVALSGGRKKIMALREQRRKEDLANALAFKAASNQQGQKEKEKQSPTEK